jgi:pimeloyl-ACP methyl ester carboxylesterase
MISFLVQKSTIVRKRIAFTAMHAQMALGARVAPDGTARRALRLFSTPLPTGQLRARESDEEGAEVIKMDSNGIALTYYVWGDCRTEPYVLLAHGWSDYALRFLPWVRALRFKGYAVISLDQPGHGRSAPGRGYLVDFAAHLANAINHFGPATAIVGHSFGAAAAVLAISEGARVGRAVLIAPPADVIAATERFVRLFHMPLSIARRICTLVEAEIAQKLESFQIHRRAPTLALQALVVHDIDDREVPWAEGERYARYLPNARLLTTSGLGHNRILKDEGVIDAALRYLGGLEVGERVVSTVDLPFGIE